MFNLKNLLQSTPIKPIYLALALNCFTQPLAVLVLQHEREVERVENAHEVKNLKLQDPKD